jgi:transcriptional regulator with XRE-family HTH domain
MMQVLTCFFHEIFLMESFGKRLSLAIKELKLSKNEFAGRLGYKNNGVIYDYSREDGRETKPGFDFFEKLVHADTGINIEWLIGGKGEILNRKGTAATKKTEATVNKDREELYKDLETFREIAKNLSVQVMVRNQSKAVEQG